MSLDPKKIDALAEWVDEWRSNYDATDQRSQEKLYAVLHEHLDDALNDAYGCGEADEAKRTLDFLKLNQEQAIAAHMPNTESVLYLVIRSLDARKHDPPDPEHLAQCERVANPNPRSL